MGQRPFSSQHIDRCLVGQKKRLERQRLMETEKGGQTPLLERRLNYSIRKTYSEPVSKIILPIFLIPRKEVTILQNVVQYI